MFNNLIESSSHLREFKRRGSFVLFTSATYALLFVVAGVISIYAYDARLEDQNTEFVTMLNPMELPAAPRSVAQETAPRSTHSTSSVQTFREPPTLSVNHPEIIPVGTSGEPNKNPSVPDGVRYAVTGVDSGIVDPGGPGHTGTGGNGNGPTGPASLVKIDTPPPPQPPIEKHVMRTISGGPVAGLAKSLPKPAYPPMALQIKAHGAVNVQVLIDETGKVVSAKAVSGHPLLLAAAQQAAYRAVFSPTTLGEQPVKVSGVITYNFILP
jgi:TonB family protein